MNDLIAAFGGTAFAVIWAVFFFIIALSVIVAVHEYGHYIVGRWSGIHAEVFSIGFGKTLISRIDKRGTKWQIAAIPFGGYVKFMGDTDASSVRSDGATGLTPEERRHTMAGAPLWARAATVAAGPIANFILTYVILVAMALTLGVSDGQPTVERPLPLPWTGETLQAGDTILAINGVPVTSYGELITLANEKLPRTASVEWTVERGDKTVTFTGPHPAPAIVAAVQLKSAAVDAGLQPGDVITRAGGREIVTFKDLQDVVFNSEGRPVDLTVWRSGQSTDMTLTPRKRDMQQTDGSFKSEWLMGVYQGQVFTPTSRPVGLGESLSNSAFVIWQMTSASFSGLKHMVTGDISPCNMSGVIGMADALGDAAKAGLETFITLFATLSLGIGILNLFPIPVLDGGHLVFHAFEAVTGKPPSDGALRWLMAVGLTLLLGLMVFALLQDVTCV